MLTEVVVTISIFAVIMVAIFNFGQGIFSFNSFAQQNLNAQSDARKLLKTIAKEMRSSSPSSLGAYPLAVTATSSVTFFSNIDNDTQKEQIRYFLQGGDLKKGVINPSGTPLTYNTANEQQVTLVKNIVNGVLPIFEYYDSTYTGTSSALTIPVQPTLVRLIKITIMIGGDPNRSLSPVEATTQVFLRNLKDNL